jgi:hypothetical protein
MATALGFSYSMITFLGAGWTGCGLTFCTMTGRLVDLYGNHFSLRTKMNLIMK